MQTREKVSVRVSVGVLESLQVGFGGVMGAQQLLDVFVEGAETWFQLCASKQHPPLPRRYLAEVRSE